MQMLENDRLLKSASAFDEEAKLEVPGRSISIGRERHEASQQAERRQGREKDTGHSVPNVFRVLRVQRLAPQVVDGNCGRSRRSQGESVDGDGSNELTTTTQRQRTRRRLRSSRLRQHDYTPQLHSCCARCLVILYGSSISVESSDSSSCTCVG